MRTVLNMPFSELKTFVLFTRKKPDCTKSNNPHLCLFLSFSDIRTCNEVSNYTSIDLNDANT
jgi:hypothetical protein